MLIITFVYFSINLRWHENLFTVSTVKIEEINKLSARLYELGKRMDADVLTYRFEKDENIVEYIKQDQEESNKIINSLIDITDNKRSIDLLQKYIEIKAGGEGLRDDLISATRSGSEEEINKAYRRWSIKARNIDAALADLSTFNAKNINRLTGLHEGVMDSVYQIIILTILSTIFLIITLYYYLRRTVTLPVLELSAAANKIAQGKFNVHIEPKSQDEVGLLYRDLMRMEGQLREYYKGLESEVRKKEKELEESRVLDKRKDDFISIASHELKTPITSMKIFTELLKRQSDVGQDERSVNYLNRIDDQINRLISLVNQLLDVSKIRAGGLKLRKSKFYIDRLVKETVDELEENMPKHKVIIKSLQRYKVSADKDRIQQVLINLLINAAKYSPNADKIIVSGKLKGKRNVVVSVKDFGMGIAPENQGKIFEKFFRIYEDKDKTFPGLGMGLHIASNIIKKHNGKIWFESEPHKGSTFYFSLPIFIEEENIRRKYGQKNTYN